MVRSSAELAVAEDIKDRYRRKLSRWPELADRIINHVDEGRSLVEGMQPPADGIDCEIVHNLARFKHADEGRQDIMITLARQNIAERT